MPRPPETPDVRASKTLAYILRHGAEKESLHMRSDGYVKLSDVLSRPKMREVDLQMVLRLVDENAKQRFELFYGYDPSPPPPKSRKGQGSGKGKGKGSSKSQTSSYGKGRAKGEGEYPPTVASATVDEGALGGGLEANIETKSRSLESALNSFTTNTPGEQEARSQDRQGGQGDIGADNVISSQGEIDAARIENLSRDITKSSLASTELPLISLPAPTVEPTQEAGGEIDGATERKSDLDRGEYFIRATQGHSIKLESTAHLEAVEDTPEGRERAGVLVHGTRWELWDVLLRDGLSRMDRTHIHLAPALSDHRILPRPNSTLRIYLDLPKLLIGGIPIYTSLNGVVLTPGDERGLVESRYWKKAERKVKGEWVTVLEDGVVVASTIAGAAPAEPANST